MTSPDPDQIAERVRQVQGVADLWGGVTGEVATYLPGRRVTGVRMGDAITEVHVVVAMGTPVLATAAAVRAAVHPLVGTEVQVYVEDVNQS